MSIPTPFEGGAEGRRRRSFVQTAMALPGLLTLGLTPAARAQAQPSTATAVQAEGKNRRRQVLMLAYPQMTAIDLVAPQLVFASMPDTEVHVAWKDTGAIVCDSGLRILPTTTLEHSPQSPDVLFVPGGLGGTTLLLRDPAVIAFLRDRGATAAWVTSVCTGSLLLGAAGLLKGYKATSHWYVRDLLPVFGSTPVDERVVADHNRVTGAGATASLDFALTLSSLLNGADTAQLQTLVFEYAPHPPFATGTPDQAGAELTKSVLRRRAQALDRAREAVTDARAAWPKA